MRGHAEAIDLLRRAIAHRRVASAYLFVGPRGVGKDRVALALAQSLNCATPAEGGDACGACASCRRFATGRHPDLLVLQRALKDGTDEQNAALRAGRLEDVPESDLKQEIVVDQVEEVVARMPFRPHEGGTRWVIVREADRLNAPSANKLLKTLEEPPADTHFALLTHRPSALLPTIRSRCQALRFGLLGDDELRAVLAGLGLEAEVVDRVAPLADGSVGRALSFVDGEEFARRRTLVDAMLAALRERSSVVGTFAELGEQAKSIDRGDLVAALTLLARHFRVEAIAHATEPRVATVHATRAEVVREALESVDGGGTLNPQLLVQATLARLREVRP